MQDRFTHVDVVGGSFRDVHEDARGRIAFQQNLLCGEALVVLKRHPVGRLHSVDPIDLALQQGGRAGSILRNKLERHRIEICLALVGLTAGCPVVVGVLLIIR